MLLSHFRMYLIDIYYKILRLGSSMNLTNNHNLHHHVVAPVQWRTYFILDQCIANSDETQKFMQNTTLPNIYTHSAANAKTKRIHNQLVLVGCESILFTTP